jgi:hypothetical protein
VCTRTFTRRPRAGPRERGRERQKLECCTYLEGLEAKVQVTTREPGQVNAFIYLVEMGDSGATNIEISVDQTVSRVSAKTGLDLDGL